MGKREKIIAMTNVASESTKRLLQLSYLPGVGAAALRKIVLHAMQKGLASISDDQEILATFSHRGGRSGKQNGDISPAVLETCERDSIRIFSPLDKKYPPALGHIEDFPPLLYVRGNAAALSKIGCAVVGTREASHLGTSWAKQISEIFSDRGYCVVSGLALGIDTAAHEGALRSGGITVAVMAHGLDHVTPASNKDLSKSILENQGALVSEHPPGVPPRPQEYVRRNRIQSGMSVCSVVVESGESGGSIHQGKFTHKQGRRLYCVVPDQTVPGYSEFRIEGARRLMSEANGHPIHNSAELLEIIKQGVFESDFVKLNEKLFIQKELF